MPAGWEIFFGNSLQPHITKRSKLTLKMIEIIDKSWKWTGKIAKEIVAINDFGNVIFTTAEGEYFRICPEELSCHLIARSPEDYEELQNDRDFIEDWEITEFVELATKTVGKLDAGEKYCLKLPAVLYGEYSAQNIGKIAHEQLISFAGEMAEKIKDLPDGTEIKL